MENFLREATEQTPYIFFDCQQHVFEIRGISYPDDTMEFFEPMFDWLKDYFAQSEHADLTIIIEIVYFHSGSTKVLFYFLDKLLEEANKGTQVTLKWMYAKDEQDMLTYGKRLQRDFKELAFHFIENEDED